MRTAARVALLALALAVHTAWPSAQAPRLGVLNASPNGEVGALADANEIRITFSEPMIALGAPPAPAAVPWFSITPAARGAFYWSGTRTLIFTPNPSARLPYATRFAIRVDASARAVSGRTLAAPFEFSFTTPTVRLLSAEWYRRNGRAADPVVVALRFNQPMRPQDVLTHTVLQGSPHAWTAPRTLSDQRRWLDELDPAGLSRLNAKVARAEGAASSRKCRRRAPRGRLEQGTVSSARDARRPGDGDGASARHMDRRQRRGNNAQSRWSGASRGAVVAAAARTDVLRGVVWLFADPCAIPRRRQV